MANRYFKPHESFDLNSHKYDVGVLIGLKDGYEDNLFIKKILELPELEYEPYYLYHIDYFLGKEPQVSRSFSPLFGRSF